MIGYGTDRMQAPGVARPPCDVMCIPVAMVACSRSLAVRLSLDQGANVEGVGGTLKHTSYSIIICVPVLVARAVELRCLGGSKTMSFICITNVSHCQLGGGLMTEGQRRLSPTSGVLYLCQTYWGTRALSNGK